MKKYPTHEMKFKRDKLMLFEDKEDVQVIYFLFDRGKETLFKS